MAVLVLGNNLRNDGADFLGNHTHFVFAIRLQVVGNTTELFDCCQGAVQGVNVGLQAARAVANPAIRDGLASTLTDGEDIRGLVVPIATFVLDVERFLSRRKCISRATT